jgi:hypothetical protein
MPLAALGPNAKAKVTSKVDIDTSRGHGFKFNNDRIINPRTKKKTPLMILSSTLSMTELFPTDALKYLSLLYTFSSKRHVVSVD